MRRSTHTARPVRRGAAIALAAAATILALAACSDDDSDAAQTIPVEEWVAEFDQLCVEITGPEARTLSEVEFKEVSDRGLAEMRALPDPDEHAAEAAAMLAAIEATTDPDVADADIEALDQQFLDAAAVLDVSDACIGGPQG